MLDCAGVGELAIEEREPALLLLVTEGLPVAVASLDDVHLLGATQGLEVLHPRAPAECAVDGDIGVLGEEILGEVTSGHAGDAGDQNAHCGVRIARAMPRLGRPAGPTSTGSTHR